MNTIARSPSRIERSRTRLPVGLRSLICEKFTSKCSRDEELKFRLFTLTSAPQITMDNIINSSLSV